MVRNMVSVRKLGKLVASLVLLTPYILYVWFIVQTDRGPIDYETFMSAGSRLLRGEEVWTENSYYPMPYVMVFALFAWLPRPLSMAIWHLGPVLAALVIGGWQPWVLAFGPVFGHTLGGQTVVFAMLGLWVYRRHLDPQDGRGGVGLALTTIKPQLGIVPTLWAAIQWWKSWRRSRRIPHQLWAWLGMMVVIYLPGFVLIPDWPMRWLSQPRPVFSRALSGFLPRTLLYWTSPAEDTYWVALLVLSTLLLVLMWCFSRRRLTFDLAMLWSFTVSPLVHDYDLVQLLPLLDTRALQWAAMLLSLPGWFVIAFAYSHDAAWYAFTIIAPCLLLLKLRIQNRENNDHDEQSTSDSLATSTSLGDPLY